MPLPYKQNNHFHWHTGCRFSLLVDGEQYFPTMLAAIDQAKYFILLELYLVESGHVTRHFIKALIRARQRGVVVYLLLDDYGCRFLEPLDREILLAQDIKLVFYNPFDYRRFYRSLRRDHRKLLLVDGVTGFTGGTGLSDAFAPPFVPQQAWHEVMVQIEGPVVADWEQVFSHTWQTVTGQLPDFPAYSKQQYSPGQSGRVALSAGLSLQEIKRAFIKQVRHASQRVWLTTPYFIPSLKIRRALIRRARAGVDVRLLLPGPLSDHPWVSHAARGFYHRLLRHGIRIFEYQPRFTHAKIGLCDDWCTIGSSNLDRWNQRWNLDGNQEIDAPDFAAQVAQLFETDFAQSREITLDDWLARSRVQRLQEWLAARLVMLIELVARRYRK
ncbi:MAG: phospholipase D-like domain-containing protein [Thiohalophilus sp.]|uniref:phospholipase D-like domain-containing protein n=1 Tax=Thiohalophilus sp. TaxID=3028392 RepID=UPI0028709D31|nr:phospholipase D-like domain-containing protein [Thiohalophilus sp.]MDR9435984.1 phospholipase D-like domain-containing protein [Thiohalophilus sp.]